MSMIPGRQSPSQITESMKSDIRQSEDCSIPFSLKKKEKIIVSQYSRFFSFVRIGINQRQITTRRKHNNYSSSNSRNRISCNCSHGTNTTLKITCETLNRCSSTYEMITTWIPLKTCNSVTFYFIENNFLLLAGIRFYQI